MLTVEDLTTEQQYFIQKQRHHNRYLHGWGIVSRFGVTVRGSAVLVGSGVAIDCEGNEIILSCQVERELPPDGRRLYVLVEYCEIETDGVPVPLEPCTEDDERTYTRIREGCEVTLSETDPTDGHEGIGPGTQGCGRRHPVTIATLIYERTGWKVAT
jgi:hypothetical protein